MKTDADKKIEEAKEKIKEAVILLNEVPFAWGFEDLLDDYKDKILELPSKLLKIHKEF